MKIEDDISKDNTPNKNLRLLSKDLDSLYYRIEGAANKIDEVNDDISAEKLDKKNEDVIELITKYFRIEQIYEEFLKSAKKTNKILKEE